MEFPQLDEYDRPTEKLPDCPQCEEDELGVIHHDFILCYCCGWSLERSGIEFKNLPLRLERIHSEPV